MEKERLLAIKNNFHLTEDDFGDFIYLDNYNIRNDINVQINYGILCRYYTGYNSHVIDKFKNGLNLEKLPYEPLIYFIDEQIRNDINSRIESIMTIQEKTDATLNDTIVLLGIIINNLSLSNDKTTIGTLEYTDTMAKFGVNNISCEYYINPELISKINTNISGGENKYVNENRGIINDRDYMINIQKVNCKDKINKNCGYIEKYMNNFFKNKSNVKNIIKNINDKNKIFEDLQDKYLE